jgi:predicted HD superfamily hydrolase involved in NAD metabolism
MSSPSSRLPNPDSLLIALVQMLSPERYKHTLRVVEQTRLLASKHSCILDEAVTAAILHDCAKDLPIDAQLKLVDAFDIVLADVEKNTPALLHAIVGAELARRRFSIESKPVLDAIRWHTTGRPGMSILEKVIFLADYTEPDRQFDGVDRIRETALHDIDLAMLLALEQTITYVLQRGWLLHPDTVSARNCLLMQRS